MKLYEAQFSEALDRPESPAASKTIIIASTGRSGSHMLGHAMTETGAMGVPLEYCNELNLNRWRAMTGKQSVQDVLRAIMARRTTSNGVFAIKLHHGHLKALGGLRGALDFFPDPHIVQICRANILKQAISRTVAQQTGAWIDEMEGNGARPIYNRDLVLRNIEMLALNIAHWERDMRACQTRSLMIEYTQAIADTPDVLRRIAAFCGIESYGAVHAPPTRPQGSRLNDEWVERFYLRKDRTHSLLNRAIRKVKRMSGMN
jgi:LPS sulfotransferase NodH